MKTERSKQLIEQALRAMPPDFSLRDARYHMSRALAEIHKIEKKKAKKQQTAVTPRQQWEFDLQSSKLMSPTLNGKQQKDYIKHIDDLIAAEQAKIDSQDSIDDDDGLFTD